MPYVSSQSSHTQLTRSTPQGSTSLTVLSGLGHCQALRLLGGGSKVLRFLLPDLRLPQDSKFLESTNRVYPQKISAWTPLVGRSKADVPLNPMFVTGRPLYPLIINRPVINPAAKGAAPNVNSETFVGDVHQIQETLKLGFKDDAAPAAHWCGVVKAIDKEQMKLGRIVKLPTANVTDP